LNRLHCYYFESEIFTRKFYTGIMYAFNQFSNSTFPMHHYLPAVKLFIWPKNTTMVLDSRSYLNYSFRRYSNQNDRGFLSGLINSIKGELARNKELKENLAKLKAESERLEQSEAYRKARQKFELIEKETMKSSEYLRVKIAELQEQMRLKLNEAKKMKFAQKGIEVGANAVKSAKEAANVLGKSMDSISQTRTFQAIASKAKMVKEGFDDFALSGGYVYERLPKLRKRRECIESCEKKSIKPNSEVSSVEVHKDQKWYASLKSWTESNAYYRKFLDVKMQISESENPFLRGTRYFLEKFAEFCDSLLDALLNNCSISAVLTEICKIDPNFSVMEFRKQCQMDFIPNVIEASNRGEEEILRDWCSEGAFNQLIAILSECKRAGYKHTFRLIDIENVEVIMGKMTDMGPVLLVAFQTRQLRCIQTPDGKFVFGTSDNPLLISHLWAFCRDVDEPNAKAAWRVVDVQESSAVQTVMVWINVPLMLQQLLIALLHLFVSSSVSDFHISSAVVELDDKFMRENEIYLVMVRNACESWLHGFQVNRHFHAVQVVKLLQFYAPWCGYCKRLMPTWEQVALTLSNEPITVGKLDCTKHTSVTSELKINGYPTIRMYRYGEKYEYHGERSKEAIVDFALKVIGPEVRPLSARYELVRVCEKLKKTAFFLLAGEKNFSNPLIEEYYTVAKKLFSKTYFYQISPRHLPSTFPCNDTVCIFVVKDGTQFLYNPTIGQDSLEKWIQSTRWPFMQLAKYETLNEMGECCSDKLLVVAVLDLVEKRKLKSSVKQYAMHNLFVNFLMLVLKFRLDDLIWMTWQQYAEQLKGNFEFVWLDGNEIANSILLRTVPVPCLFVFNASSYAYYLPDQDALQMTEELLLEFLQNVANGSVAMRGGKGRVQHVRRILYETTTAIYTMFANQPLLACCLFGLPLGIFSVICYTICSTDVSVDSDEIYADSDESDSDDHEKEE
ncbi:Mitochondrial import inner membrane translocase subunit TIM44, partial [Trichinella pseudospiralis]